MAGRQREHPDPALRTPVGRDRRRRSSPTRCAAGRCRCCSRTCCSTATRHVGREELIGALWPDRRPRPRTPRCGRCSRACARRSAPKRSWRPRRADARASPSRCGSTSRRPRSSSSGRRPGARSAATPAQRLGARPGPAQHRQPRAASRRPGAWLEPRRRDLEDMRLQALEVDRPRRSGARRTQLASVERAARALIDSEPYRESGYVLLMEALAAQGNVAEGLRVFERLRTLLRDELGTAPSPEAIDDPRAAAAPRRAPRGEPCNGADATGAWRSSFRPSCAPAGRCAARRPRGVSSTELGAAVAAGPRGDACSATRTSGRGSSLLAGDPGIGKTRLAGRARRRRPRGRRVRARRAVARGGAGALPAVPRGAPALRASTRRSRSCARRAREYGSELARLVPELRRRHPICRRRSPASPRPSATGCSRRSSGCSPRSRPARRSCSCSTTCTGPTARRCCCCATWPARSIPGRLLILGAYRTTEATVERLRRRARGPAPRGAGDADRRSAD